MHVEYPAAVYLVTLLAVAENVSLEGQCFFGYSGEVGKICREVVEQALNFAKMKRPVSSEALTISMMFLFFAHQN